MIMKKYTLLTFLLMIMWSVSYSQYTASLAHRTASPNDTVKVNLNVTGFNSIGSIQFYIQIDPQVLTFQNVTGFPTSNLMVGFISGNTVTLIWTNPTPYTFPNGTLLTLNFKYHGLTSPVEFLPANCEVSKIVGGIPVPLTGSFNNGSVSPFMGNAAKAHIDTLYNAALGPVSLPLKYTGFPTTVGAITQKISFDPAKLTFISVTGTGNLASGMNANVSGGIITITWSNPAGKDINYPGSMFNLNFEYINASNANVSFRPGCVIETTAPVTNIPITYFSGLVTPPLVVTSYAAIGTVSGVVQGQTVDVPVTFTTMPANTTNFNLNILFDNPRLSFIGVFNAIQPVITNVNGNQISVTNANPLTPSPSINGQFMMLRFVYVGVGVANISFGSGCQFSNGAPIGVGYSNGSIAPGVVPGNNVTIGYVSAASGNPVAVPVTFTDMPADIGAVTMFINYDNAKLTYTGATNPYGANIKVNGNVISVVWTSTVPSNLNGPPFVTLQFNYISGAGSNCAAEVNFTDGCQIATVAAAIIPTNWINGGVNVRFLISGNLKYNSDPQPRIPLVGHMVKLLTMTDDLVGTFTTNATGYFEFRAPNGNYKLTVEPAAGYIHYVDLDDVVALFDNTMGTPFPYENALRLKAGDVNENGYIDLDDVVDVFQRTMGEILPDYTAPDWIYEDITVTCSCADLPDVNIMGLNSGNVLGTNPTP